MMDCNKWKKCYHYILQLLVFLSIHFANYHNKQFCVAGSQELAVRKGYYNHNGNSPTNRFPIPETKSTTFSSSDRVDNSMQFNIYQSEKSNVSTDLQINKSRNHTITKVIQDQHQQQEMNDKENIFNLTNADIAIKTKPTGNLSFKEFEQNGSLLLHHNERKTRCTKNVNKSILGHKPRSVTLDLQKINDNPENNNNRCCQIIDRLLADAYKIKNYCNCTSDQDLTNRQQLENRFSKNSIFKNIENNINSVHNSEQFPIQSVHSNDLIVQEKSLQHDNEPQKKQNIFLELTDNGIKLKHPHSFYNNKILYNNTEYFDNLNNNITLTDDDENTLEAPGRVVPGLTIKSENVMVEETTLKEFRNDGIPAMTELNKKTIIESKMKRNYYSPDLKEHLFSIKSSANEEVNTQLAVLMSEMYLNRDDDDDNIQSSAKENNEAYTNQTESENEINNNSIISSSKIDDVYENSFGENVAIVSLEENKNDINSNTIFGVTEQTGDSFPPKETYENTNTEDSESHNILLHNTFNNDDNKISTNQITGLKVVTDEPLEYIENCTNCRVLNKTTENNLKNNEKDHIHEQFNMPLNSVAMQQQLNTNDNANHTANNPDTIMNDISFNITESIEFTKTNAANIDKSSIDIQHTAITKAYEVSTSDANYITVEGMKEIDVDDTFSNENNNISASSIEAIQNVYLSTSTSNENNKNTNVNKINTISTFEPKKSDDNLLNEKVPQLIAEQKFTTNGMNESGSPNIGNNMTQDTCTNGTIKHETFTNSYVTLGTGLYHITNNGDDNFGEQLYSRTNVNTVIPSDYGTNNNSYIGNHYVADSISNINRNITQELNNDYENGKPLEDLDLNKENTYLTTKSNYVIGIDSKDENRSKNIDAQYDNDISSKETDTTEETNTNYTTEDKNKIGVHLRKYKTTIIPTSKRDLGKNESNFNSYSVTDFSNTANPYKATGSSSTNINKVSYISDSWPGRTTSIDSIGNNGDGSFYNFIKPNGNTLTAEEPNSNEKEGIDELHSIKGNNIAKAAHENPVNDLLLHMGTSYNTEFDIVTAVPNETGSNIIAEDQISELVTVQTDTEPDMAVKLYGKIENRESSLPNEYKSTKGNLIYEAKAISPLYKTSFENSQIEDGGSYNDLNYLSTASTDNNREKDNVYLNKDLQESKAIDYSTTISPNLELEQYFNKNEDNDQLKPHTNRRQQNSADIVLFGELHDPDINRKGIPVVLRLPGILKINKVTHNNSLDSEVFGQNEGKIIKLKLSSPNEPLNSPSNRYYGTFMVNNDMTDNEYNNTMFKRMSTLLNVSSKDFIRNFSNGIEIKHDNGLIHEENNSHNLHKSKNENDDNLKLELTPIQSKRHLSNKILNAVGNSNENRKLFTKDHNIFDVLYTTVKKIMEIFMK